MKLKRRCLDVGAAAWSAGLLLAVSVLADEPEITPARVAVSSEYSRSTGSEEVVLEVEVGGGFGRFLHQRFRLFGDGRLEERRSWAGRRRENDSTRDLQLPAQARDRLLRRLVEAGVPGATRESLVSELRAKHPRIRDLLWSDDCPREELRLWLFRNESETLAEPSLVTDLALECSYRYRQAYPGSARLVAFSEVIAELMKVADAADRIGAPQL